jgi:hypothetical protein
LRAEQRGDRLVVTAVLVGRRAFFEHFGLGMGAGTQGTKLRTSARSVPWESVVRFSSGALVVRDGIELSR